MKAAKRKRLRGKLKSLDSHYLLRLVALGAGNHKPLVLEVAKEELQRRNAIAVTADEFLKRFRAIP